MVTWMIWINEQYAHFGSKVISVTEREGLHTLDAIVLADDAPESHTADTHGATELVFAGFDLLGRRFIPRLSDIADIPLYGPRTRPIAPPLRHCSRATPATS